MKDDYKCDCCGKFINLKDFDNGATRQLISSKSSNDDWETICIKCNKESTNEAA